MSHVQHLPSLKFTTVFWCLVCHIFPLYGSTLFFHSKVIAFLLDKDWPSLLVLVVHGFYRLATCGGAAYYCTCIKSVCDYPQQRKNKAIILAQLCITQVFYTTMQHNAWNFIHTHELFTMHESALIILGHVQVLPTFSYMHAWVCPHNFGPCPGATHIVIHVT